MVNINLVTVGFVVLFAFFIIFLVKKIHYRILVIIGLVLLCFAAGFFVLGLVDQANSIATLVFGTFLVAIALAFIDYLRGIQFDNILFSCPSCGADVPPAEKFCPECGNKLPVPTHMVTGEARGGKAATRVSKLPFLLLSVSKKTVMIALTIICVAALLIVVVFFVTHLGTQAPPSPPFITPKTLVFTITNNFTSNASCYLLIDHLRQGTYGDPGFVVNASSETTININESTLLTSNATHSIELVATIGDRQDFAVIAGVTQSATFLIDNVEGQFDVFYVKCTSAT